MEPDVNPYQPSSHVHSPQPGHPSSAEPRDGWKFLLLAIAMLTSLTSIVPWLGVILIFLSGPVFLTWYDLRICARGQESHSFVLRWLARALGWIRLGLAILAASAAAFLGTCSITAWSLALSGAG